jgi:ABC-type multidrug transport system ATPase subunit
MDITIKGIQKRFLSPCGMKEVLKNIAFSVPSGKLFTLTGPNGSGKTTLLKILAALILPDGGDAFIGGDSVRHDPVAVKRHIGLVFDPERSFYHMMTAEENLRFYAALFNLRGSAYRGKRDLIADALGLSGWLGTPVRHCSSGIKQKLAIARALLPGPSVILIDELSRSLDPAADRQVSRYIRKLTAEENRIALVVTHDRRWADEYADEQWRLNDGVAERAEP